MVKLYVDLITAGIWTIEKVPNVWKSQVQEELDKTNQGA
ncbi:CD1375 family protein [Clostridium zeae]|nr:CD1375 family protein [Clostridium zeae]